MDSFLDNEYKVRTKRNVFNEEKQHTTSKVEQIAEVLQDISFTEQANQISQQLQQAEQYEIQTHVLLEQAQNIKQLHLARASLLQYQEQLVLLIPQIRTLFSQVQNDQQAELMLQLILEYSQHNAQLETQM
ncbi:hypothetical protein [Wolbachia endosymbiont of Pentidionis agamae]|uniref:hypothetical protein n=1 Tax=Wolbachia endosymbiont of Pentidionis agamae TaxID=3110435 RepID=UPI002FD03B5E